LIDPRPKQTGLGLAAPFARTRRQSALALAVLVACLAWVVGISTLRLLGWTPWATGMVPLAG